MKRSLFSSVNVKNVAAGIMLAVAGMVATAPDAWAQKTLRCKTVGDWHLTGTWQGGNAPSGSDNVVLEKDAHVTVRSTINGTTSPALITNVTIEPGAKLTIENGAALTVSTTFTFAPNAAGLSSPAVDLNGTLTIANTSANPVRIVGHDATRYFKAGTTGRLVITNIGNTEVIFPVGTTTYTPAYVTATTGAGTFAVGIKDNVLKFANSGPQIMNGVVNRTWDVSKVTSAAGTTVALKFKWNPATDLIGTFNAANATVVNFHNNAWNFPGLNETTVVSDDMVMRSNVTLFSPFAVQDAGINPLPVELLYFHAAKKENATVLTWETAAEKNNKGFEVQTSADGKNYEAIGSVATKNGNANYNQRYEFLDKANRSGLVYYRLKQTDLDGTVSYYAAKVVDMGRYTNTVAAYPNPFHNEFKVNLQGAAQLEVTDLTGKVVYRTASPVTGTVNVELNNQPAGLYLLKTTAAGQTTINRLVKQ